jgi:hypothetical protein
MFYKIQVVNILHWNEPQIEFDFFISPIRGAKMLFDGSARMTIECFNGTLEKLKDEEVDIYVREHLKGEFDLLFGGKINGYF